MAIPIDSVNNVIAYLKNECGIGLIEKEDKVEIARVTFESLE
jgi:hypothetical protein